jgi:purine-cytosine permease-like protein
VDVRANSGQSITTGRDAIEARSIDWIPDAERRGKVWKQGPFWFLGNFSFFSIAIGFIGPSLGLSLMWTIVAGVLGASFGGIFMAFHASQGPKLGLPQMIQSRAQFGYRGDLVPLLATLFNFMVFNVLFTNVLETGLNGIFGWNSVGVAVGVSALGAALAIYGHDWLHRAFRFLFWCSIPFYALLTVGMLTRVGRTPFPADSRPLHSWQ